MGRQSRFADGMGLAVRRTNGRGDPRLRISALRYPLLEGRRVRNRQFGRKPAGMPRAATLPYVSATLGETMMSKLQNQHRSAQGDDAFQALQKLDSLSMAAD